MELDKDVVQQMAKFAQDSKTLLEKAAATEQELLKRAADTVDALVKSGKLEESQRKAAEADLVERPWRALDALKQLVQPAPVARTMGKAAERDGEKSAAAEEEDTEANRAYDARLGI